VEIQWNGQNNKRQWYIIWVTVTYTYHSSRIRIGSKQSSFEKLVITLKKTDKKMFFSKGFLRIRFLQANTNILNVFMCTHIYEVYVCMCVCVCVYKEEKKKNLRNWDCNVYRPYIICIVRFAVLCTCCAAQNVLKFKFNTPARAKIFLFIFIEYTYIICHLVNSEI